MAYKAIIAGASGLIGSSLLTILLNEDAYDEVTVLVRKTTGIIHTKLTEIIIDFDKLDDFAADITGHVLFCCIGTTKNKTPDLADYYKIEHDYPVKLGQLAVKNGVKQYHYVSSIGADKNSAAYYTKFKGQTEYDLQQLNLPSIHIYRPSILSGDRKDHRPMEKFVNGLMYIINSLLIGSLKKYRSIPAKTVAMAMYKQSINSDEDIFIHPSDHINELALEQVRLDLAIRDKYQITFTYEYNPTFHRFFSNANPKILSSSPIAFHIQSSHIIEIRAQINDIVRTVDRYNNGLPYDEFWGSIVMGSQLFIYPDTNTVEVDYETMPLPDFLEILKEWEWFIYKNQSK